MTDNEMIIATVRRTPLEKAQKDTEIIGLRW